MHSASAAASKTRSATYGTSDDRASPGRRRRSALLLGGVAALALILAALWSWTPLGDLVTRENLSAIATRLRSAPWAPFAIVAFYVVSGFVVFPNTVLNFATIVGLGGFYGFAVAMVGSLAAAMVFYAIGRRYGAGRAAALGSDKVEWVRRMIKSGGIPAVFLVRSLPIAPCPVVNLVAGVCKVKVRHYLIGTILGLLPGMTLVAIFGRQLRKVLESPSPLSIAILGGLAAAAIGASFWLKQRAKRYQD